MSENSEGLLVGGHRVGHRGGHLVGQPARGYFISANINHPPSSGRRHQPPTITLNGPQSRALYGGSGGGGGGEAGGVGGISSGHRRTGMTSLALY